MPDPTNTQITRTLAEFMGWSRLGSQWNSPWGINNNGYYIRKAEYDWSPPTNRNDLAEVLAELSDAQWEATLESIRRNTPCFPASLVDPQNPDRHLQGAKWLLTCDPAIIARAVAEVVSK